MKLKSLPALKEKKRYIVFRVHSNEPVQYHSLKAAIFDSLLDYLGEGDLAKANIRLIKNLCTRSVGFLQTTPKYVDQVKLCLSLIHQIGDQRVIFQTLKVSGTILSGKKALKISPKPKK